MNQEKLLEVRDLRVAFGGHEVVHGLDFHLREGEKLALAAAEGKLQFALRNASDTDSVLTTGATIPKTLASLQATAAEEQKASGQRQARRNHPAAPPMVTVETIRGDKVEKLKF